MTDLKNLFPSLHTKLPGPFDALRLWKDAACWSHGERLAAAFVLSVYNPDGIWGQPDECGAGDPPPLVFDLHEALCTWDARHRAAFLTWASNPWWP